jgi:pyruvate/2-oxoglutarate dehydrogenase complex dihydrolipoamide acyltransferase (E2) component
MVGAKRYEYAPVNLGFTVQAGETLYLAVLQHADGMDAQAFIRALGELQRHAMGHKLKPEESQGATMAFSSMSRWGVTRHTPILPPQTSIMVAHAATKANGKAVLGATYDHRVLSGFDVVRFLSDLSKPPELG